MKTVTPAWAAHAAQNSTNFAVLWKVIRLDGTVMGFTNHDAEIVFIDSDNSPATATTYVPMTGGTGTATETDSDMNTSNQKLLGFLDSEYIQEVDLFGGLYNYAVCEIRIVNYTDLTQGALLFKRCTFGEVKTRNGQFEVELLGLESYLNTNIGETYGPTCRADLGDARCTINLALWIQNSVVGTVQDLRTFVPVTGLVMRGSSTPTVAAPDGWFNSGVITWLTGQNKGFTIEVLNWDGTTIQLFEDMPYPIAVGDTYTIEPGCNKSTDSNGCGRYNNIENFIGENFIPGSDLILLYPNADGSI